MKHDIFIEYKVTMKQGILTIIKPIMRHDIFNEYKSNNKTNYS